MEICLSDTMTLAPMQCSLTFRREYNRRRVPSINVASQFNHRSTLGLEHSGNMHLTAKAQPLFKTLSGIIFKKLNKLEQLFPVPRPQFSY